MVTSPLSHNPKTHAGSSLQPTDQQNLLVNAAEVIQSGVRQADFEQFPSTCLILGSGLGELADCIDSAVVIPYRDIPGFPLSRVAGHAGNLVIGYLDEVPVAALAGRAHLYEGWSHFESTFPIRVLHHLGSNRLIASNASGGINPRFQSGQVVLIDQHIDWFGRRGKPQFSFPAPSHNTSLPSGSVYDPAWNQLARQIALQNGYLLEFGTYLATTGPSYETRAEYRAFSKMGADMVGMSTVHEVSLASSLGMRCIAFSIVTNVANPDFPTKTDHAEVLSWSEKAQAILIPLIKKLIGQFEANDSGV